MKTRQIKGNGTIREGRIELDVPHLGKTITYVLPLTDQGYHGQVMHEINSQNLLRPTAAQVFSLIDFALQNQREPPCDEIVWGFNYLSLWTATEGLTHPKGHIAYDNIDGNMPQTSQGLFDLIDKKDPRARFIEPGFKTGVFPLREFLKNPVLLAYVGEEMIPTVERVAKALNPNEAYVFAVDSESQYNTRALSAIINYGGFRLNFEGGCDVFRKFGCAAGILKR